MSRLSQRLTAGTTDPPVVQRVIDKLEGLLTSIRDRRPKYDEDGKIERPDTRPKAVAVRYIAQQLGCSVRTVLKWLALHEARRNEYEISESFCDVYERIGDELTEVVDSKTFTIATSTAHPQSFAAQKYLLPKLDPYTYGERRVSQQASAKQLSDYPSELFDEMTEERKSRLRKIEQLQDALDAELEEIIKEQQQQLKDREAIDSD